MMIIAHRGASGSAPENTLAAFHKAIELGADWLELDVCATRDRQIVVFHDDALDRTTDGCGPVQSYSLAELRRLDAGSWFDRRFAGEQIPTLHEVIALAKATGVGLFIEMKPGGYLDGEFEVALARLLEQKGMLDRVFVMSFNHAAVGRVKAAEQRLRTLLLVNRRTRLAALLLSLHTHKADGFSLKASLATGPLVRELSARGLTVVVWTVNGVRQMRRFLRSGVDGITTDHPERLARLARSAA
jgi:glycerophosphoryl diester phosphodiesterase